MNSEQLEGWVLIRDGAAMIQDGAQKIIESAEPQELKWDSSKINFVQTEGARGPYWRYPAAGQKAESTEDYRNMIQDLINHNEKLTRDGFFYWLFSDGATVGRKKTRLTGTIHD
jgi:hypothetical protein